MHHQKRSGKLTAFAQSIMATALLAATPAALAQDDTANAGDEQAIEEIVVIGIRASLQDALSRKKNAENIRDVISAEDIGKLPDKNVAEALQRVTGVQIGRSFGEGEEIAVRGIAKNRIEVNGQTQVGTGFDRDVSFTSLPAEMFSSLEVIKTPTADETEGGLGAIIRLNTRKPLDVRRFVLSGSLESSYSDRAEETTPGGALYIANKWTLDSGSQLGASLNLVRNERKLRQDFYDLRGWTALNGTGLDVDGNGVVDEAIVTNEDGRIQELNDGVFRPDQARLRAGLQDRTYTSVRGNLQFRSDDGAEWYIDASYTENTRDDQQYQYLTAFNSRNFSRDWRLPLTTITPDQTAIAGVVGDFNPNGSPDRGIGFNIASNKAPNEGEVVTFAISHERSLTPQLSMKAELAYGSGEQFNDQLFATTTYNFRDLPNVVYDFAADTDAPMLVAYNRGTPDDGFDDPANRADYSNKDLYTLFGVTFQDQYGENEDKSFKVDFDYELDRGDFYLLEFGVRLAERSGGRHRDRVQVLRDTIRAAFGGSNTYSAIEAVLPDLIISQPFADDILDGASGDFVRDWFTLSPDWLSGNEEELQALLGVTPVLQEGWGYDVTEETRAAYVKLNFAGVLPIFGGLTYSSNIGVRYVETDQKADGFITFDDENFEPFTQTNTYDNVLPSANMNLQLLEDRLFLRLAAAKTIGRARLQDIAPLTNLRFFVLSGTIGNPDLVPEEVTQYDLSLEYYFSEGSLLSLAYFNKEYSNAIEDGFIQRCFDAGELATETRDSVNCAPDGSQALLNLATKINAGESRLRGFEVAWQQPFTMLPAPWDGLGVQLNYTYTDSTAVQLTRTGFEVGLQDLSENSYNVILYYEKGKISTRAAYNWRDTYYNTLTQANGAELSRPFGQLDASASYKLTDKWEIGVSVINALNEPEEAYQEIRERFIAYRLNDTRFALTLRGRF